jgi:3-mercaptopyruvate sulfurtransferase SseA
VAQYLLRAGWKDVHALHGGFERWQEAQGAVEKKRER